MPGLSDIKLLVIGAGGQLGHELWRRLGDCPKAHFAARAPVAGHANQHALDLADAEAVRELLHELKPDVIINAAAYTAVDRAESEPEAAYAINTKAPRLLAELSAELQARLVHVSTDYVFGATTQREPLDESTPTAPLGVYGRSKLDGEQAVLEHAHRPLVLRTAWVYAAHGHNFVRTMLRLGAEREALNVVDDQIGSPSWAADVAAVIIEGVEVDLEGLYHVASRDHCSWYEFALGIFAEAEELGLIENAPNVAPIPSSEFPTPAARPPYSALCVDRIERALNRPMPAWREALKDCLYELAEQS